MVRISEKDEVFYCSQCKKSVGCKFHDMIYDVLVDFSNKTVGTGLKMVITCDDYERDRYGRVVTYHCHCMRCENEWDSKSLDSPVACPKCGAKDWKRKAMQKSGPRKGV